MLGERLPLDQIERHPKFVPSIHHLRYGVVLSFLGLTLLKVSSFSVGFYVCMCVYLFDVCMCVCAHVSMCVHVSEYVYAFASLHECVDPLEKLPIRTFEH